MRSLLNRTLVIAITMFLICLGISLKASDTLRLNSGLRKAYNGALCGPKFTKQQWIIRKSRLNAGGLQNVIYLNGVGIEALDYAFNLKQISIKLKSVPIGYRFAKDGQGNWKYETGMHEVYKESQVKVSLGLNYILFNSQYVWNDSTDLIIEFCKELDIVSGSSAPVGSFLEITLSDSATLVSGNHFNSVCQSIAEPRVNTLTHNVNFLWDSINAPPIANFEVNKLFSCDSSFEFYESSTRGATQFLWDFGDGNTDTNRNPFHAYAAGGKYKVKLKVFSTFGVDSITKEIEYNPLNFPKSNCLGSVAVGSVNVGIKQVEFGGIFNDSQEANIERNADFSCMQARVKEGQCFSLSLQTFQGGTHHTIIWLDANNDGIFNAQQEKAYEAYFSGNLNTDILVPGNVELNKALRLRIAVSRNRLSNDPCQKINEGQFEDYSVLVDSNFILSSSLPMLESVDKCLGLYHFRHNSKGHIDSLKWDFGDGDFSKLNQPVHKYGAKGNYWVTLIIWGYAGHGDTSKINIVVTDSFTTPKPNCIPKSFGPGNIYGINKVQFSVKQNISGQTKDSIIFSNLSELSSLGYSDYTCDYEIRTKEGEKLLVVTNGSQSSMDYYYWLDLNNDGIYTSNELGGTKQNANSGAFTISFYGIPTNVPLRLRVGAFNVGAAADVCGKNNKGEIEDYTLFFDPYSILLPDTVKPISIMKSGAHFFCSSVVEFQDSSSSNTTKRNWFFGDGQTGSGRFVSHNYTQSGDYLVKLVAENNVGTDTSERLVTVSLDSCKATYFVQDSIIKLSGCKGGKISLRSETFRFGRPKTMQIQLSVPDSHELTLDVVESNLTRAIVEINTLRIHSGPTLSSPILGTTSVAYGYVKSYQPNNNGRYITLGIQWSQSDNTGIILDARYRCISLKKEKLPDGIKPLDITFNSIFIYPNPVTEYLFVGLNNEIEVGVEYEIVNVEGQSIILGNLEINGEIAVNSLKPGMYFIRIKYGSDRITKRFIKL